MLLWGFRWTLNIKLRVSQVGTHYVKMDNTSDYCDATIRLKKKKKTPNLKKKKKRYLPINI